MRPNNSVITKSERVEDSASLLWSLASSPLAWHVSVDRWILITFSILIGPCHSLNRLPLGHLEFDTCDKVNASRRSVREWNQSADVNVCTRQAGATCRVRGCLVDGGAARGHGVLGWMEE